MHLIPWRWTRINILADTDFSDFPPERYLFSEVWWKLWVPWIKCVHVLHALEILKKKSKQASNHPTNKSMRKHQRQSCFYPCLNFFTWTHRPNSVKHLYGHLFKLQNPLSAAGIERTSENRAVSRPAKLIFHVIFHSDEIIFYYQANTIIKISPCFRGAMTDTFLPSALKAQSCFCSNEMSSGFLTISSEFRKRNTHFAVTYKNRRKT